jgi:serine/threonine protein kinase
VVGAAGPSDDDRTSFVDISVGRDTDATGTLAGQVLGTPGYMSPEQLRGDANLDGRSDVYALGCILFELLAREPLHPRSAAVASTLAGSDPRPSLRAPTATSLSLLVVTSFSVLRRFLGRPILGWRLGRLRGVRTPACQRHRTPSHGGAYRVVISGLRRHHRHDERVATEIDDLARRLGHRSSDGLLRDRILYSAHHILAAKPVGGRHRQVGWRSDSNTAAAETGLPGDTLEQIEAVLLAEFRRCRRLHVEVRRAAVLRRRGAGNEKNDRESAHPPK